MSRRAAGLALLFAGPLLAAGVALASAKSLTKPAGAGG